MMQPSGRAMHNGKMYELWGDELWEYQTLKQVKYRAGVVGPIGILPATDSLRDAAEDMLELWEAYDRNKLSIRHASRHRQSRKTAPPPATPSIPTHRSATARIRTHCTNAAGPERSRTRVRIARLPLARFRIRRNAWAVDLLRSQTKRQNVSAPCWKRGYQRRSRGKSGHRPVDFHGLAKARGMTSATAETQAKG